MAFPADACHNLQTADVAVAAVAAVAVAAVASASACCRRTVAVAPACNKAFACRNLQIGAVVAAAAADSPAACLVVAVAACPFGPLGWGSSCARCSWGCRSFCC